MATRELLSPAQRLQFTEIPNSITIRDIARYYTFSNDELKVIKERRRPHNRLGFAVQLCYLRFPGRVWSLGEIVPESVLSYIASQLKIDPTIITEYSQRDTIRREHLVEIQNIFGFHSFNISTYKLLSKWLLPFAISSEQGMALVGALIDEMRFRKIIIPAISTVERLAWEVRHRAQKLVCLELTQNLTILQKTALDKLLILEPDKKLTDLIWLRQPPGIPNPRNFLKLVERLEFIRNLHLDSGCLKRVHQNRLLQFTKIGAKSTPAHLSRLDELRRYAILVAFLIEWSASLVDYAIGMHDKMMGKLFNKSEHQHGEKFQHDGKAINDKVRLYAQFGKALIAAREEENDAYQAIESVLDWEKFINSVVEAEKLARPADFDYLELLDNRYSQLRRYTPKLLETFEFKATTASLPVIEALAVIKELNISGRRNIPESTPTSFVKPRWLKHVMKGDTIDRHYYEMCALAELRSGLRSGDIWVVGSRQFQDFEDYLLTDSSWQLMRSAQTIPVAVTTDFTTYIEQRSLELKSQLGIVSDLMAEDKLVDVRIEDERLIITPLSNAVPTEVDELSRKVSSLLPRIKLTDLLVEVDSWTHFTKHFTHLYSGTEVEDKVVLLSALLADGINLGLTRMADATQGMSFERLAWVADWYIRDETYSQALAEVVNFQAQVPFAAYWGDGTTSSSDGQRFKAGGHRSFNEEINAKYGKDRSVIFYTHISDQYVPFHVKVINATVRDASYVLDGLLYHESDLQIQEHYTDTSGYTEQVFAMCHLLGFRFAPRMRDLPDKKLYTFESTSADEVLSPLLGGKINVKLIEDSWDEILRLASSIRTGTVTASLMLRKLASYPRQNRLALALRELGRIERTLFTLEWLQSPELRRRATAGLNKGEAKHTLKRAVFFNRLGEVRDRSYEDQFYRASGLNLVVAAIVVWNTVYIEKAVEHLKQQGMDIPEEHLQHLSPLGWEHINLTGDYVWNLKQAISFDKLRPLRVKENRYR
ncbi:Tn3 family transposase [Anabaena cylindrica]|uniref:Transposase Tn3 family protein n=2 Tax=Nostocaceae TaxID=1162 RepID=K9ZEI0_ANACC|nr:Tn3 family transposase [Anabaena cylindrica]AFZ56750.1 transposase Tn3 family protein [Anabaena cylindrica PCC 7122]BAY06327.1 transposase Tn3 family protein [Anabaena cylindrica PCC 7122]